MLGPIQKRAAQAAAASLRAGDVEKAAQAAVTLPASYDAGDFQCRALEVATTPAQRRVVGVAETLVGHGIITRDEGLRLVAEAK